MTDDRNITFEESLKHIRFIKELIGKDRLSNGFHIIKTREEQIRESSSKVPKFGYEKEFHPLFYLLLKRTKQENIEKYRNRARGLTVSGFMYLFGVLIMIAGANVYELVGPTKPFNGTGTVSSVAMHCTKNITVFNVKFTPGSIAEDCASRPRLYNLNLSQCSELLG